MATDVTSDCSSELSETPSELESRIYGIVHHNDFSGTTESPVVDSKYGVEFSPDGEVIVYLKDPVGVVNISADKLSEVCNDGIIPTIILDNEDNICTENIADDIEFAETSLKKRKRKKKKRKMNDESIDDYIKVVKETNALEEYKEKSGLNKMKPKSSNVHNVALNVAFCNERALPMTTDEVLKQYKIGKPTECSLWYRCPKTWTPDMIKFYTKVEKSKRNFDCNEELRKIREKHGSNPMDWSLHHMDLYKSHSNTSRIRCNICRQFGHTAYNCKEQYKPQMCIMCGMEGHNFNDCNKQICLSCGTWQRKFTNNCNACVSMSRTKCNKCNTYGHESNYCNESWRQFHSTISTAPEPENHEFAQPTSRSNVETIQSTTMRSDTSSLSLTPNVSKTSYKSPKTDESGKSCKSKKLKRLWSKNKHSKKNLKFSDHESESINIDVNIQDVTLKRTLTKRSFFKKKKISFNN